MRRTTIMGKLVNFCAGADLNKLPPNTKFVLDIGFSVGLNGRV